MCRKQHSREPKRDKSDENSELRYANLRNLRMAVEVDVEGLLGGLQHQMAIGTTIEVP
jgi:hypothetical protein